MTNHDKITFFFPVLSLFAILPSPLIYGALYDSSCQVWATKCEESLNCLVYDTDKLKRTIISVKITFLMISCLFDMVVWYYCKDLDIYGDAVTTTTITEPFNDTGEEDKPLLLGIKAE